MIADIINFVIAQTGFGWLAMLIIKSTVVIGLGLLLWLTLRPASASARHLVLGATLVATILLPVISVLTPPLLVPVLDQPATTLFTNAQIALAPPDSVTTFSDAESRQAVSSLTNSEPATILPLNIGMAIYLAGGLVWSSIVFCFDRFIVSTFRKSQSTAKDITSSVFLSRLVFRGRSVRFIRM